MQGWRWRSIRGLRLVAMAVDHRWEHECQLLPSSFDFSRTGPARPGPARPRPGRLGRHRGPGTPPPLTPSPAARPGRQPWRMTRSLVDHNVVLRVKRFADADAS